MFGFTTWFQYLPLWRSFDASLSIRLEAPVCRRTISRGSAVYKTPLPPGIAMFDRESQAYRGLLAFPATRRLPADGAAITAAVTRTLRQSPEYVVPRASNWRSTTMQCEIETWNIDRFVPYARNPRKNDAAVDRMAASITEFGFKIPVLARSNGEVVDGHLRLKAAQKLGLTEIPVVLCDEWSPAQVKAFRLMVNRSVTWADWDEELLALELLELKDLDFDLSLTGFDLSEIDCLHGVRGRDRRTDR